MPITPLHWGPSSWVGLLGFKRLNFGVFLIANVIIDIEPFCVLVFNLNYPMHGYLHTFLGGTVAAGILAPVLYGFRDLLSQFMGLFKLGQRSSFKVMLVSCLLGVYFHIILDSFLYTDIKPFYPTAANPFYGLIYHRQMYSFCELSFILGGLLYAARLTKGVTKAIFKVVCFLALVGLATLMTGYFLRAW